MCLLLHGLSHSVPSNHPVRAVLPVSQSLEEETAAVEVTPPKVTLGPLCVLVDFAGELGVPGWDCELCDLGKWLSFSEPQFLNLKNGGNSGGL